VFTGIVQGVATLVAREDRGGHIALSVKLPVALAQDLKPGMSVALDGVCMTVTTTDADLVSFDAVEGTLSATNLGDRRLGDKLNVERSLKLGEENGGHEVSGHVSGVAVIDEIDTKGPVNHIRVRLPEDLAKYVFDKGFIALNGASLTVAELDPERGLAKVNLIPETLRQTTFAAYGPGDRVNVEVEMRTRVMVEVIERVLSRALKGALPQGLSRSDRGR
jgi:riboflavin synthase